MPDSSPQLVSKKKFVVNQESFFSAPRLADNYSAEVSSFEDTVYESANNANYFPGEDIDKVRVVLGRNWDYRKKNPNDTNKVFSSQWSAPRVFYNSHVQLESCEETETTQPTSAKEKIVLKSFALAPPEYAGGFVVAAEMVTERFQNWLYFVKTGVTTETGIQYKPIIQADKWFFDHHHESFSPFTAEELENKQPAGKTYFANFKTYYNERIDSSEFELVTGKNPRIQNSLPSIYSFLRLLANKSVGAGETFDLGERFPAAQGLYGALSVFLHNMSHTSDVASGVYTPLFGTESFSTYNDLYIKLLKKYPLETLLTLYGSIGAYFNLQYHSTTGEGLHWPPASLGGTGTWGSPPTKIIEKIITLNFDNFDADSLFSNYFKEYTSLINIDARLNPSEEWLGAAEFNSTNWTSRANRIIALERIMTNLVFTPDSLKFLNKVDQYKKHFPFYVELEFTANILTSLGDSMKQLFLTKFVSEAILSNLKPPESDKNFYGDTWVGVMNNDPGLGRGPRPYIDFMGDSTGGNTVLTSKTSIDFPELFVYWLPVGQQDASWLTAEGVHSDEQKQTDNFSVNDLRNYTTFFRSDFSEPINIDSDDNVIFKKLFGSAFYAKILSIYENNKRSYSEILAGAPAYSEDLFYRIEKIRKFADSDEEVVQNILIPNTSELDVVKYVDTQLKYSNENSNNVIYRYNIYVHRVVFGSKYRYHWLDSEDQPFDSSKQTYPSVNLDLDPAFQIAGMEEVGAGVRGWSHAFGAGSVVGVSTSATFQVEIQPNIKIIEDKIFSTPDIIIIDKPPVIPDVNIVPYRAINNRILILLTGASDRYRAKPILMLEGDEEEFNKIKAAQLSFDDKVEFGSDDPVKNFQIFRTQQKPKTYSDFELYDQISQQFYEETILPNTKYYYTFRAIDNHDHISNPTPVYEVELIDEQGAVKPVIRLVDMEPQENKTNKKDCQKYIYLKPALKQIYFSDNPEVDSIFSSTEKRKKYRMRLTSKGSGKKIDINFSFKKKIQTDETLIE